MPKALATYFNYDKGIAYRTRDNYSNSEWDEVIRHELDNGRPIVALGRSSAGGHAFVFDGYDKNGLVHVNWGWSGMSNGYFRTTALTPAMQGIGGSTSGYNYSQYIVTGIQKPQDNTEEDVELISTEGLVPGQTTVTNGQPVSFRLCGFLANVGWKDSSFDYGLIITDSEGNNVSVVETGTSDELPVGYQIVAPEFKDVRLGTIAEGSYTVYPACRVKGGKGQWNRIRNEYIGYPNHLYMECKDNTITFSYPDYFNLAVSGMEAPGTVYSTVPANTKATITNNGDVDYLGEVTVSIVDKDTKRNVTSGEPYMIDLKPGESIDLSIVDTYTLEPGDYCLTIVDDDNRHIAPYADITVNAAPTTSAVIEPADLLSIAGDEQVDRMAMDITAKVTCKYGVFGGMLYIYLFSENGSVQLGCLDPQYVFLKQGETADVRFTGTFENGVPGTVYTACLMAYNGSTLSFIEPMEMSVCQFRLAGTSGIDGIGTSSDEPALIYDISGKRLPYTNIDTLPKGLYIIKQGKIRFITIAAAALLLLKPASAGAQASGSPENGLQRIAPMELKAVPTDTKVANKVTRKLAASPKNVTAETSDYYGRTIYGSLINSTEWANASITNVPYGIYSFEMEESPAPVSHITNMSYNFYSGAYNRGKYFGITALSVMGALNGARYITIDTEAWKETSNILYGTEQKSYALLPSAMACRMPVSSSPRNILTIAGGASFAPRRWSLPALATLMRRRS